MRYFKKFGEKVDARSVKPSIYTPNSYTFLVMQLSGYIVINFMTISYKLVWLFCSGDFPVRQMIHLV
jgi:hypothetical protein